MEKGIKQVLVGKPTLEGAGVRLKRIFGSNEVPMFDPFLLLDHFGSDIPEDYLKGFPWHPHRGIETVTYMLSGEVKHGDSIGNEGVIKSGDVQWMTAGSGIIHQEMPLKFVGLMQGFQLWVNLPAVTKMMGPRYRGITKGQIPTLERDGIEIKVISGKIDNITGPVTDLVVDVEYLDVTLGAGKTFEHESKEDHTVFAYIINGNGYFETKLIAPHNCVLFKSVDYITIRAKDTLRFLLISGKPLNEPIVWGGPIVMNSREELDAAFLELKEGTFIKDK